LQKSRSAETKGALRVGIQVEKGQDRAELLAREEEEGRSRHKKDKTFLCLPPVQLLTLSKLFFSFLFFPHISVKGRAQREVNTKTLPKDQNKQN
jgi:hypothetical protein